MAGIKTLTIGFLGCGSIGGGVYALLDELRETIAHREGLRLTIKRVLVRDVNKRRVPEIDPAILTDNATDVIDDPEIDIIVEFLGGAYPAADFLERALKSGKTVVTANKAAITAAWPRLDDAAKKNSAGLYFEAAVAGGIPVLRALEDSLQANRINRVFGIINGTTNSILSRMAEAGLSYDEALAEAQAQKLAEPDPSADVDGLDAANKLSILASLSFHVYIPVDKVYAEGIRNVTERDITDGKSLGMALKLLAVAKREGQHVELRVHPAFIPAAHPLAAVGGAYNAIFLHGHAVGDVMLYGRGAGDKPTASAIVSDILIAAGIVSKGEKHRLPTFVIKETMADDLFVETDFMTAFYIRLNAVDQPGALASVAATFARHGIGIASVLQNGREGSDRVPLVLLTHRTWEKAARAAINELDTDWVTVESVIRVEALETNP